MVDTSIRTRASENASGIAAVVVTGTWLALLMLDFSSELWLAVMLFGYIAVVPIVSMLFEEDEESSTADSGSAGTQQTAESESTDEALQRLRQRYADGELTEDQFERKLERLLETETLEDVERRSPRTESTDESSATARDSRTAERLSNRETERN
ncbi:SHOCT domain-containing protein [Halovenus sp. WSH3]|uniref:SHOCT domain-containing protein n=1 Tax=Halovenus carboxidivorans TaxID=2692199 RepID=A0A6B0T8I2_9EURY|nr:SHOCT domain-containing protein [Halovenus carboxidivorans]MXR51160.1 SHOCT domain-containing protein [Halovenus carboxidivorans]